MNAETKRIGRLFRPYRVRLSAVLGLIGSEGYAAYGVAKAGLVALTRQIATEFGPNVRANVIALFRISIGLPSLCRDPEPP